jgi:hypothetical protein
MKFCRESDIEHLHSDSYLDTEKETLMGKHDSDDTEVVN